MGQEKIRLGILAGNLAYPTSGGVLTNISNARTYAELERRFPGASLAITMLPTPNRAMNSFLPWSGPLLRLPALETTIAAQKHLWPAWRAIRQLERTSDVLFIRMPFQLPQVLPLIRKPMVLHVGSDVVECVRVSRDYRHVWRQLALGFARFSAGTTRALATRPNVWTVTNGEALLRKVGASPRTEWVVSSCLKAEEAQPSLRPADPERIRLLFVGYFRPEKGLDLLVEAFNQLRTSCLIELSIVGGADRQSEAIRELTERIEASPFREDIHVLGELPFGEELFSVYRNSDILVLPSRSEGTPRTLVEARAFGCVVAASRVGGIPSSISDGIDGLLFDPNVQSMVGVLRRLVTDPSLRSRLRTAGYSFAARHSVEAFGARLEHAIQQVVLKQPA
jgi:glycosyltransferase involved in cell wall biosynthesis